MASFDITSAQNRRIKRLVALRERSHRDTEGVFVVEGAHLVQRAIEAGLRPVEVYIDRSVPYEGPGRPSTVKPEVLDRVSYRRRSQGILAVFEQFPTPMESIDPSEPAFLLAAESIEKPGNLGAMLRTADAVGADAFIAVGDGVDPFNPNVVRSSTGALFSTRVAVTTLSRLGNWLSDRGIPLYVATPGGARVVWSMDLTSSCALMVGSEHTGLTSSAERMATSSIALPMRGLVDSLNASVTLAVLGFEVVRQRRSLP